jgi:hypothetical protein
MTGKTIPVETEKQAQNSHNDQQNGQPDKKSDLPLVR